VSLHRIAPYAASALAVLASPSLARAQTEESVPTARVPATVPGATNLQPADEAPAPGATVTVTPGAPEPEAVVPTRKVVVVDRDGHKESKWGGPSSQHFYLDTQAGVEWVQLETFVADFNTYALGLLPSWGVGPSATVGLGGRLGFFTLGGRGRVSSFGGDGGFQGAWQLWTLDAEVGVRVPLGRIEPHVAFAGGYAQSSNFGRAVSNLVGVDLHGLDLRIGGGADYWVLHNLSIGAEADFGVLAVTRPGVSLQDVAAVQQVSTLNQAKQRVLEASGSSVGTVLAVIADVGVHF
jgi:hypothetical protein